MTGRGLGDVEGLVPPVARPGSAGIRVSLRAVSETDVGAIATRFGGGGHRFAAGFSSPGTVAEVLAEIRAALASSG